MVLPLVFFIILICEASFAVEPKRVDVLYTYEYLTPNSTYGNWHTIEVNSFWKAQYQTTPFLGVAFSNRTKEGKAFLYVMGAYKDWNDIFYTYTAFTVGTNSAYYPKYRIDQEFNYKTGINKNVVISAGIAYVKYWNIHKDLILSLGTTFYTGNFVLTGKVFRNISNPGDVVSHSLLVSVGYGAEKERWTYLDFYYGKQAYLATYLSSPEEIDQNSTIITLNHREWLGYTYGVIIIIGFMNLEDGYDKYRFSGGVFKEF